LILCPQITWFLLNSLIFFLDAAVYQFHLFCSFCLPVCGVLCVFWLCSSLDLPPTERFRIWELKRIASSMAMNLRQSLMTGVCLSLLSLSICMSHIPSPEEQDVHTFGFFSFLSVVWLRIWRVGKRLHTAYKFSVCQRGESVFLCGTS
jgi:hypothetical protein